MPGDETGKVKFQYIEDYAKSFSGSIDIWRGQRDWLNGTYKDLLSQLWTVKDLIYSKNFDLSNLLSYKAFFDWKDT